MSRDYCLTGGDGQVHKNADGHHGSHGDGRVCHPVVVIDPESIPHLRDFADDARGALHVIARDVRDIGKGDLDATEQIIEWLADRMPKPRIEEPAGLGAVVRDCEGILWTRVESGQAETRNPWYPADCDFQPDEWANLGVTEILSEGVSA